MEGLDGKGPFDEVVILNKVHSDFVRLIEKIDHRRFASGGDDGIVVVWDVEECKDIHTLQAHKKPIACLHVIQDTSSSRMLLLSSSSDHQIIAWDVDAGEAVKIFPEQERMARCLATLSHGYFLSGGEHLLIWNFETEMVQTSDMKPSEDITLMEVMQDRWVLIAVDNHIMVVELTIAATKIAFKDSPHLKLKPHREVVTSLNKIGESCFISGSLDGSIMQWAVDGWVLLHYYNLIDNYLGRMRIYPYSVQKVVVVDEKYIIAAHGDSLHCYNAFTKRLLLVKKTAHHSKINHLCVLYDGHLLATCGGDSVINVWRIHQKSCTPLQPEDEGSIGHVLSTPDISITLLQSCSLHSSSVLKCVAVVSDRFLSSGTDHRVLLWRDGFAEELRLNEKVKEMLPC